MSDYFEMTEFLGSIFLKEENTAGIPFAQECEASAPMRYRYMVPLLLFVRKKIEEQLAGCGLDSPHIYGSGAGSELDMLYYEHLDLLSQSAFYGELESRTRFMSDYEQAVFMDRLSISEHAAHWKGLLEEQEILRRLVVGWSGDFISHAVGLVKAYKTNYDSICGHLGKTAGGIAKIEKGDSDIHGGGRVHILQLACGEKIVYKPRSLRLDMLWQEFLTSMAEMAGMDTFYVPWIIDCGDYGFEEYVSAVPVEREEDFQMFYRRCGFLLGIAYVLQGSDLHSENMIAHGSCPVLVDLDTGVRTWDNTLFSDITNENDRLYQFDSVLRTNLLPFLTAAKDICPGNDAFTTESDPGLNLPWGPEGSRNALSYAKEVEEGFRAAYETVKKYGITTDFSSCSARFLLRNTSVYHGILRWLCQRESVGAKEEYERRLEYLDELYDCLNERQFPCAAGILDEEKAALKKGYIPRLTVKLSERWRNGKADETCTIADLIKGKADRLNEADLELQCRRIRTVLYRENACDRNYKLSKMSVGESEIQKFVDMRIREWQQVLSEGDYVEGIVLAQSNGRYYLTELPWNIMEGIPGLLPFLAAWYAIMGESETLKLLKHIAARTYHHLRKSNLSAYKTSLPEGLGGLWAMTGMVRTFIELPEIEAIREMLSEEIKKPRKEKEYLLEEEEKDICTEEELVSGLTEGLDGVLFPSFFHGEGGWLYSMLRRNYPGKIPYIMLNGREDSDGGC